MAFDIIMSGNATPSQMGGFLMALRVRGETVAEITGAPRTMRAKMLRVPTPPGAIDTAGTGGDGAKTYQLPTQVARLPDGPGGVGEQHGNRRGRPSWGECGRKDHEVNGEGT